MYTIQFYTNPHNYPNYGSITAVGEPFTIPGIDIDDAVGEFQTDKLSYAQRFSVNYLSLVRDGVTLYAEITNITRVSGANLVRINFKIDAFRSFKDITTFGTQMVVRQPTATFDLDPLLRGATGEVNDTIVTEITGLGSPGTRWMVIQIMRPTDGTMNYRTPVQPSPYVFYLKSYTMSTFHSDTSIQALMNIITDSSRPTNIATIYTVPSFFAGALTLSAGTSIPIMIDGVQTDVGTDFRLVVSGDWANALKLTSDSFNLSDKSILRTRHTVSVIIPEAGVLQVPDEILFKPGLKVRQDIDLYTGASNYMLIYDGVVATPYSVRSGGVSNIPIAYDMQQQTLASNRTSITAGIVGDVASVGIGLAGMASAVGSGGLLAPAGIMGGGMALKGAIGLVSTFGALGDAVNSQVNPPSYLGSATVLNYAQRCYLMITKGRNDNASIVNTRYGYPVNQIQALTIPSSGYIQTQDCNVSGPIPMWARQEINTLLNDGLRML